MIFVTVGNATQPFARLLSGVDSLAQGGYFGEERVFAQTGHTPIAMRHCDATPFLARNEFRHRLNEASLVISHGGATILEVIRSGKRPVVMPRRKCYGEHVNDHQVQFARALEAQSWVVVALEAEELAAAVQRARSEAGAVPGLPASRMLPLVAKAIEELGFPRRGGAAKARRSHGGSKATDQADHNCEIGGATW